MKCLNVLTKSSDAEAHLYSKILFKYSLDAFPGYFLCTGTPKSEIVKYFSVFAVVSWGHCV